jgi:hypothetical protein
MLSRIRPLALIAVVSLAACGGKTGQLTAEQEQRINAEGLLHRADDMTFRYTHDAGRYESGWENRKASILVTRQSVIIHKNEKLGIEITPRSRRFYDVHRDGNRVRINAGTGRSVETWSFTPPDDSDAWTKDIRAVIKLGSQKQP